MEDGEMFLYNELKNMKKILSVMILMLLMAAATGMAAEIKCPDIADIYIDEWKPDENFSTKDRVLIATNMNIHHGIARGLFLFYIPDNMTEADIKSAAICLSACAHCGGGNGGEIAFYALNKPFNEATDTWNSLQGGDWDNASFSEATMPAGNAFNTAVNGEPPEDVQCMDITGLMTDNLQKIRDNGIMMRFADEHQEPYTHQNVASRESEDPLDFHPYVSVMRDSGSECPAEVALDQETQTLNTLRRFRDEVLSQTPEGKKYIELYYRYAPEISRLLVKNTDLRNETRKALKKILPNITRAVEDKTVDVLKMREALQGLLTLYKEKTGKEFPLFTAVTK